MLRLMCNFFWLFSTSAAYKGNTKRAWNKVALGYSKENAMKNSRTYNESFTRSWLKEKQRKQHKVLNWQPKKLYWQAGRESGKNCPQDNDFSDRWCIIKARKLSKYSSCKGNAIMVTRLLQSYRIKCGKNETFRS